MHASLEQALKILGKSCTKIDPICRLFKLHAILTELNSCQKWMIKKVACKFGCPKMEACVGKVAKKVGNFP